MNVYQEMARAMEIFASYDDGDISAEHDEMWAGPTPEVVSAEDRAELETLGWLPSDGHECFHKFV